MLFKNVIISEEPQSNFICPELMELTIRKMKFATFLALMLAISAVVAQNDDADMGLPAEDTGTSLVDDDTDTAPIGEDIETTLEGPDIDETTSPADDAGAASPSDEDVETVIEETPLMISDVTPPILNIVPTPFKLIQSLKRHLTRAIGVSQGILNTAIDLGDIITIEAIREFSEMNERMLHQLESITPNSPLNGVIDRAIDAEDNFVDRKSSASRAIAGIFEDATNSVASLLRRAVKFG